MKISFNCKLELNFEQKKDQEIKGNVCRRPLLVLDLALKLVLLVLNYQYLEYLPFKAFLILLHLLM